jgi:hypothetical protein
VAFPTGVGSGSGDFVARKAPRGDISGSPSFPKTVGSPKKDIERGLKGKTQKNKKGSIANS